MLCNVTIVTAFATALLAPLAAHGPAGALQPTSGPGGGPVSALVRASDGDLFAFAGELHRSADRGWSWQAIPAAPGTRFLAAGLASDVWAWHGSALYRTIDDGLTWTQLPATPAGVRALAFAPPQKIFAGTANGLFISTDAGATWALVTDVPAVNVPAVSATPTVTAAAADRSIYQSEDGGATWTHVATLDAPITTLAVSPQGGYFAGAGVDPGHQLMRILADGTAFSAGLGHYIEHILVQPDGVVYIGSGGSHDGYNPYGMGLYRSGNGAAPWTSVGCPGYVRGIVAEADGHVLAAMTPYFVDYGDLPACGVIRTGGPGTELVTLNRGLGKATVYELAAGAGTVYASADWRIQWTTDDGVSWNEVAAPLPDLSWPEEGMRRLAVHPNGALFAVHSTSPMYRSSDHGRTWTELPFDSVIPPHAIAVTPQGKLLVAAISWPAAGNDLWQSTDLGETWTTVMSVSYPAWILSMAAGPLERLAVVSTQGIAIGRDGEAWGGVPRVVEFV